MADENIPSIRLKFPDLDLGDQGHFLDLLPEKLAACVAKYLEPDDFLLNELELESELRYRVGRADLEVELSDDKLAKAEHMAAVRVMLVQLRKSIWDEFERVRASGGMMNTRRICHGICTAAYLFTRVGRDRVKLRYLMQPPIDYRQKLVALDEASMGELQQLMRLPTTTKSGYVDSRFAKVKLEIWKVVDQRLRGAVVQKVDSRRVNVNLQGGVKEVEQLSGPRSVEQIDEEIKRLREESSRLERPGRIEKVRVVESTPVLKKGDELLKRGRESGG